MNKIKYNIWVPPGMDEFMQARAIIFNGLINHSDMVPKNGKIIRAGFINFNFFKDGTLTINKCYGRSESLNLDSNELLDKIIIQRTLTQQFPYF